MDTEVLIFPFDWPNDCPPIDAQPVSIDVFRVVASIPPLPDDFRTYWELGKFPKACACKRRGLSVLPNLQAALHCIELFPSIGKKVMSARLQKRHGKSKATPSSSQPEHWTWWPAANIDRAGLFSPCA